MSIHGEALSAIRALREWIKAVPADVAAALPAMPGVDADWLDMVEGELVMFVELEGAHADAHARFRTLMGIPFDESRATQAGDSEEVRKKLPLPCPQGKPGMGGVLLHGTVLVSVEGQDRPQPRAVARMACPMCHGDSGYHRAVPVDGTLPTGNPNVPMTAQYVACARCDGADGVSLDGAHWHREPVFPIGYETQPANGQRIAGLSDQRQNEPQIIPETISAPQRATEGMSQAPIPVSERLPVDGQDVLFKVQELRDGKPYGNHGRWLGGRFRNEAGRPTFSTPGVGWQASHWLPMPAQCVSEERGGV